VKGCKKCNKLEPEVQCEKCDGTQIPSVMGDECLDLIPNCDDTPD